MIQDYKPSSRSLSFPRPRFFRALAPPFSPRSALLSSVLARSFSLYRVSFDLLPVRHRQRSRRKDRHVVRNACVQPTASSAAIQAQVAPSLGVPVFSRTIRRCLAEGHLGSRRPLRVLPLTPTHRRHRLEWCRARGNWTAAEWKQVAFSDETRFNLSSDHNRVRVWRPRGERLNPALALQRHTAPTAGLMVWSATAYNTRLPIVLTRGTITAQ
ncbi:transposable element Tcb2 transposase [Trichonephila clavipes]|nr:transposable element Tcb2 transposase [Trichonephila clavipes]